MYPSPFHLVRYGVLNAVADFKATYTWRSWSFGWLGRMLAQVLFFTGLGGMLDHPGAVRYLALGNALMTCVVDTMAVVATTSGERRAGTLSLLVASPADPMWVFAGRSLHWPVSGFATASVALFGLGPFFGVTWAAAQVPLVLLLIALTALGTYCVGLFLAVLVINVPRLRNVVSNCAYLAMMAFCGVQVPVDFWPRAVGAVVQAVPLTHTLRALRAVSDNRPAAEVFGPVVPAVLTAGCWLLAAVVTFRWLVAVPARRAGTLDLSY
ncbi:ABC transporter permease [Streptomyces heilongjiangensis]|uniref:ABC transporter permease n=1 Tax=Streptomyces heilongjiangensis TaxID=945052 RepID=A0ABW1B7H0_9ACTN|nr:ABC transporter permease [Streptomyces heilongjiangensis]MDC2950117.1 ABC transporter permease [Streptomyces heilongjiangensis]